MSTVSSQRGTRKNRPVQMCSRSRTNVQSISPVIIRFRQIFPQHAVAELMKRTGAKHSHCEKVIAGSRELGAGFQQKLLQSDVGREILIALMADAKPKWWVGFRRHLELADIVKSKARLEASIEAMQREMAE